MGKSALAFAGVAGMEAAQEALAALAVDPRLKGVLIAAGPGRGKSLLVRSFRSLINAIQTVPFVEVPLNVTEDRLLGGIDWERTLLTGKARVFGGLLAAAHGGFLVVNDINLLDKRCSRLIAQALADGIVRVEREGVSATLPVEFALIGTYNPAEGEVDSAVGDACGVWVECAEPSEEERLEVLRREVRGGCAGRDARAVLLTEAIAGGRHRLHQVCLQSADLSRLSQAALSLGVEGHRADLFAARVARTWAALRGRTHIKEEDLDAAVRLAILPRSQAIPAPTEAEGCPTVEPERPRGERGAEKADADSGELSVHGADDSVAIQIPHDLLVRTIAAKTAGESRRRSADRGETVGIRGRFVRAVSTRIPGARIAVEATVRAAAQHASQVGHASARVQVKKGDLRFQQRARKSGILIVFALDTSGSMAMNRISQAKGAILRLLREAYLHRDKVALVTFRGDNADVALSPTRSVELARRVIDALPAGGGTPLAKGLEVALRVANNSSAIDPRRTVLVMLTDGKPNVGVRVASDREAIWSEVESVSHLLRNNGVASLVIDTQPWAVSKAEAQRLAAGLGGRYLWLPRPGSDQIYGAVTQAVHEVRG
jgi:magnesium chelatase subunit D